MKTQSPSLSLSLWVKWSLSLSLSRLLARSLAPLRARLRARLLARLRPAAPAAPAAPPARTSRAEAETEVQEPGACGWFDSSHELVRGLQVQELTSPESQAAALPLAIWLQLQLEGCGSAQTA